MPCDLPDLFTKFHHKIPVMNTKDKMKRNASDTIARPTNKNDTLTMKIKFYGFEVELFLIVQEKDQSASKI